MASQERVLGKIARQTLLGEYSAFPLDLLNPRRITRRDLGGELAAVNPNKVVVAVAKTRTGVAAGGHGGGVMVVSPTSCDGPHPRTRVRARIRTCAHNLSLSLSLSTSHLPRPEQSLYSLTLVLIKSVMMHDGLVPLALLTSQVKLLMCGLPSCVKMLFC